MSSGTRRPSRIISCSWALSGESGLTASARSRSPVHADAVHHTLRPRLLVASHHDSGCTHRAASICMQLAAGWTQC